MSNDTAQAAAGETRARSNPKQGTSPRPTPPLRLQAEERTSDADACALQAARVLRYMVVSTIYDEDVKRGDNHHLDRAHALLDLLISPAVSERHPHDPEQGDIEEHLKHISSELEMAVLLLEEQMSTNTAPCSDNIGLAAFMFSNFHHAFLLADEILIRYQGGADRLEDLAELTSFDGITKVLRPVTLAASPVQAVPPPDQTTSKLQRIQEGALTFIAVQADSLQEFLWGAHMRAESNQDPQAARDARIAQGIVKLIGTVADEATGNQYLGSVGAWTHGEEP